MASTPAAATQNSDEFRLPTNVKPIHYDLTFKTDLETQTFNGYGIIELDVTEETKSITFNSSDLTISEVSVHSEALKTEQVQSVSPKDLVTDKDKERVTASFSHALPQGSKAKLHLGWEGKLTGNMQGYYHSATEYKGEKRYYALTQFEPTAARRAFPSWDEPLLKAEYTVTMISRTDTVNLSNMPAVSEKPFLAAGEPTPEEGKGPGKMAKMLSLKSETTQSGGEGKGWKITRFEKSPLMSTYLLAFANGHFEHLESSYNSPITGKTIPLRIYATPEVIHQAQFSLDVKAKVMPIYEQFFQIPYPLPKLDTLVAHDFDAGAMENWGLITGRTSAFLLDPKKSDLAAKKRVATVTSHECAHLWFGDLVTMAWWDNLWLNEGFATLMGEVISIERVFPEWKADSEFIDAHLARALDLDAVRSSHPIEVPVPDANQINQIFDALSYSKAGSVLRMLSNYVGEETFLRGVAIYLQKHEYGNSVTQDLWKGIGEASGLDIPKMMDNWILKIGYPVLSVTETEGGIKVRQDRFLSTGDATDEENTTLWQIPLNLKTVTKDGEVVVDRTALLTEREAIIPIDTSNHFKLNAGTTGVYRVAYSPERLKKIGEEAAKETSVFSFEDRMGLVSDSLVLAKAGSLKTSATLDLFNSLKNEKEYLVWASIDTQLAKINQILWEQPQELRDTFNAWRRSLYKPLVDKLGYEYGPNDDPSTIQLRTLAIGSAAAAQEPSVLAELKARFDHFQSTGDDSKIPADLLRTIYVNAVRHGGRTEWETIKKVYKNPPTPSAKISAMLALTASKDKAIIEETLGMLLNGEVQTQDVMYWFSGASGNRESRRRIGKFFEENYDKFVKMFEGNFSLSYLVKFSFQYLTTEEDAKAVEAFFKDKDVSKYNLALAQSLDAIRANAKWLVRDKEDVTSWLEAWSKAN